MSKQNKRKMDNLIGNNKPEICLVLIVKNEAHVIERLIESARPHITSWCIVDTGSTDGTQDVIKAALADLPGKLLEEPWEDFATNRTQAVQGAKEVSNGRGWLLLMDADFTIEYKPGFERVLSAFKPEQGMIELGTGISHKLPLLVRADIPWYYVGRVHEYITADVPYTREEFNHLVVTHQADGGSREGRHYQDIELLLKDVEDNPENERAVYYLAQSYRDTGQLEKAAEFYHKRAVMPGWDQETYSALYQAGVMESKLNDPNAVLTLEMAWEIRPTRAEAPHQLARLHRIAGNRRLAWLWSFTAYPIELSEDILFVETGIYEWGAAFEYADALWRNGMNGPAVEVITKVLSADTSMPDEYRDHLTMILANIEEQERG